MTWATDWKSAGDIEWSATLSRMPKRNQTILPGKRCIARAAMNDVTFSRRNRAR